MKLKIGLMTLLRFQLVKVGFSFLSRAWAFALCLTWFWMVALKGTEGGR